MGVAPPMPLTYPPFAASVILNEVAKKKLLLKPGSKGPAVALLQGALIDRGFKLPRSTNTKGLPDGIYGHETASAFVAFQTKNKLKIDGIAGSATVTLLDGQMTAAAGPPAHIPPTILPPPSTAEYKLGTSDPPITPDRGAGIWSSTPKQATYIALGAAIVDILPVAYATIGDDATKHMFHYFGNSGSAYTIDLEGMVAEVPSAGRRYQDEVAQVQEFVETLSPGRCDITSQRANGGYNRQGESTNWYFAIGGYASWGKGTAIVTNGPAGLEYDVAFEYKFYDRYNWDKGKFVTIGGIKVTDAFMGEFHREGLAKEFDCYGSFKRRFTWRKGASIPKAQIDGAGGR
jgi:peptidoglycan hydrolase-like protein with peptidoglycan-binding domain